MYILYTVVVLYSLVTVLLEEIKNLSLFIDISYIEQIT